MPAFLALHYIAKTRSKLLKTVQSEEDVARVIQEPKEKSDLVFYVQSEQLKTVESEEDVARVIYELEESIKN